MRCGIVLLVLLLFAVVACGNEAPQHSPRVQVSPAPILTSTPRPALPTPTNTPPPTALWTPALPEATPRQVSVSRISDSVDPTSNLLIQPGEPAPAVVLTDIDGNTYQLDDLQGRVVIINFWTVGCGSCFYEFPLLQEVRDTLSTEDVLILAVNVSDLAEETRILADHLGATYPMVVDPNGEIFINFFGGAVVPTTYFIAPDGTVQETLVGPMDRTVLQDMLAASGISVAG